MTVLLIVNADDLGLCASVNRGIERAHREGILTSASLMANCPGFEDGVRVARENPALGVGVHLNLVRGRPLSPRERIPRLLDNRGMLSWRASWRRDILPSPALVAEAEIEYRAQIEQVLAQGICPTHLDSEKHHARSAALDRLLVRLACAYDIPAVRSLREPVWWALRRLPWPGWRALLRAAVFRTLVTLRGEASGGRGGRSTPSRPDEASEARRLPARPDWFLGQTHIGQMTEEVWLRLLRHLPEGSVEVMCHPGEWEEEELRRLEPEIGRAWLERARPVEMGALCSPRVRAAVAARGIRLAGFADLVTRRP